MHSTSKRTSLTYKKMDFHMAPILIVILSMVLTGHNVDSVAVKEEGKTKISQITPFVHSYNPLFSEILKSNYSRLPYKASAVSKSCNDHFNLYLTYLRALIHSSPIATPTWVYELLDATGKPGTGILEGNIQWSGSFTECLKVEVAKPNSTEILFRGQYCSAILAINSLPSSYETTMTNHLQQTLKPNLNGIQQPALSILLGLCLPSSCTAPEITQLLNDLLIKLNITEVGIAVDEDMCNTDETNEYGAGSIAFIFVLIDFGILLIVGTFYEVITIRRRNKEPNNQTDKSTLEKVLLSFSVYNNGRKILDTSHGEGTLTCIHGIRFLSMAWVVLGHTYGMSAIMPYKNYRDVTNIIRDIAFDIIMNGTFSVDTFFFLSGFLVAYIFLKEMKKTGGQLGPYKIFFFYFHRYWRLTPALAMAIAFLAVLYKYIANGPFWKLVNSMFVNNCQDYWWRSLLYIQTLYDENHMCFNVAWYLACDMQFYVISLLIIYPLYKFRNVGLTILGAFFIASMLTPGLIIHFRDLPAFMFNNMNQGLSGMTQNPNGFFTYVYIKAWCRMGPYIVGIMLAVVLHRTSLKVKLRPIVVAIGWLLTTVLALTLIFGTHDYFTGDSIMSNGLRSFYGACSRPAWAIVVAWVVFACVTGHGGYVNTLLSWKALIPLSRLTYTTYLVHFYILITFFALQENVCYFNHYLLTIIYLGMLILSMALAFVFSLAFEAPMIELEKIFLPRKTKDAPSLPYPKLSPIQLLTSQPTAPDLPDGNSRIQRKAYTNEGFEGDNDIDSQTFYRADGKPVTSL